VRDREIAKRNFRRADELADYYRKHMSSRRIRIQARPFIRDVPARGGLKVDESGDLFAQAARSSFNGA